MPSTRKFNKAKTSKYIFCVVMAVIPVIQFLIMGFGVRLYSFSLAFQHYENAVDGLGYDITFAGLDNFVKAINVFVDNKNMVVNSAILFVVTTFFGMTLSLIFSFYIYKGFAFSRMFKTVLFLPQIISSLIFATIFRYIITDGYIYLVGKISGMEVLGLLDDPNTRFSTLVFFNIWASFGINVLLYTGAMSNINVSVVESANLEGVNLVQEFIHITLPLTYPTIVTFFILSMVGFVTNDYQVLNLLGTSAAANEIGTIGFYIYQGALAGSYVEEYQTVSMSVLAACGLVMSLIMAPLTIFVKKLLVRFGPSVD